MAQCKDHAQRKRFEQYLNRIWAYRNQIIESRFDTDNLSDHLHNEQRYFSFDGNKINTLNYAGFVQFEDISLIIAPKISALHTNAGHVQRYLFWWLSHIPELTAGISDAELDTQPELNLPELFIQCFLNYTIHTIQRQPFLAYITVTDVLETPRGRINFAHYATQQAARGRFHELECEYEQLQFDHILHRGIKYVCRLLGSMQLHKSTQHLLDRVVKLLDEVTDMSCTASMLEQVVLTQFHSAYDPVKEWCIRFLEQQQPDQFAYSAPQWSVLVPMERVFEYFLCTQIANRLPAGFTSRIKHRFYLDKQQRLSREADLVLTLPSGKCIVLDAKYKMLNTSGITVKQLLRNDVHQLISYGYRLGAGELILCYPAMDTENQPEHNSTLLSHPGENTFSISLRAERVPFFGNDIEITRQKLYAWISTLL